MTLRALDTVVPGRDLPTHGLRKGDVGAIAGLEGARSVSSRVHRLLHLESEALTFEWRTVGHVEHVSLASVSVDDDTTQPKWLDIPATWIADARLTGGWWASRLTLRAGRLDAFDDVPRARPGTVVRRIARRDGPIAAALGDALLDGRRLGPADAPPRLPP